MIVIATITEVYVNKNDLLTVKFISDNAKSKPLIKTFGIAPEITKIYKIFETKNIIFEVTQEYLDDELKFLIPREYAFKKSELLKYSNRGLNVNESNAYYVIELLRQQEQDDQPVLLTHEGIGFDMMEITPDKFIPVFKGYKGFAMDSEYKGKLPIKPKGKTTNFQEFIKNHINGTPLSLAVALGLSSALVGFLGNKLQSDNLVAHFSGDSSTGKTTAAKLAVSMGSLPSFHAEHSLLNNYDGTENALLATILGNKGFTTCFDEANMSASNDFSNFIYRLASGRGKRRLTKDGNQKDIETYLTTIISTGEKNLTRSSNQNTGKEIRVLTFSNMAWTTSADHAETVNSFIIDNYGRPLINLAKYLLKIGLDKAMAQYERNREIFLENSLVKDTFTNRLSAKYAFILTATELANECMSLELPYDYILDLLLQNEKETVDIRDIAQKAYDYLLETASVNNDKFSLDVNVADMKELPPLRDVWGKKVLQKTPSFISDGRKCTMIIYFAKEKFKELLRKGNFEEPSVVIKKLKQKGWLDHDSDRDTRTRKIIEGGTPIDVYALRVFEGDEDAAETKSINRKVRPKGRPAKKI